MDKRFEELLDWILVNHITDLHITYFDEIKIEGRNGKTFMMVKTKKGDEKLLSYLQYISNLDVSDQSKPQSGAFEYTYRHQIYSFRFAYLVSNGMKSGVLRILNFHQPIKLEQLVLKGVQRKIFNDWCRLETGMIIIGGPTGSGKTTTAYSLLNAMKKRKIYSLEDPIEIHNDAFVQIQINPEIGLTYSNGIKQLLRHDPDVIFIGEIRDEETAHMALRCALTGHLVISTIHASSCEGTIHRLIDLGIHEFDLKDVLSGITNQRLLPLAVPNKKACFYELVTKKDLNNYFDTKRFNHLKLKDEIKYGLNKGWIKNEDVKEYLD